MKTQRDINIDLLNFIIALADDPIMGSTRRAANNFLKEIEHEEKQKYIGDVRQGGIDT